jgi:rhodanese-related sulfurtransferase
MYKNLSNNEFKNGLQEENGVLIDVRTAEEYNAGYIDGADNIDIMSPDFQTKIQELDPNKAYYIYCRSGARSASACGAMFSWGFKNVNNLANGIIGWDGDVTRN